MNEASGSTETVTPVIRITRTIAAPRQKVFDAWVKPELRKQWWKAHPGMTCQVCDIDATEGGTYRINMTEGDKEYITVGRFLEVIEPEKLVFTWRWESWRDSHADSIVTVELRDVGGKTELTLTHEKLPDANSAKEHTEGWNGCLDTLIGQFG